MILLKNKLIKNTLIILLTSVIIRGLSLLNRIILTRYLGNEGISLYSLILPTIMLFMSLSSFSLNISMTRASAKYKSKEIIKYGITIALITTSISCVILFIILKPLCIVLLKQQVAYFPILAAIPLFYLTSISTVLRGYLTGLEKMASTSIANLLEQLARIMFIFLIFNFLKNQSKINYVIYSVVAMSIGELISIIFTLIKTKNIKYNNTIDSKIIYKELLSISTPTTLNSLLSNLTFFLEPIIFTFILSKIGFNNNEILYKYSETTAYVLPVISLFSFVSLAISTVMMPKLSTAKENEIRLIIPKIIISCFIPGIIVSTLLYFYSKDILLFLYNTNIGETQIKKYVWLFIFFYLIHPFNTILQSTNNSKIVFKVSLFVHIFKLVCLTLMPFFTNDALILSYVISNILSFIILYKILKNKFKFKISLSQILTLFLLTIIINLITILINYININFIVKIIFIILIYSKILLFVIKRDNK